MGHGEPGSFSRLIPGLREGDHSAMQELWQRTFQPLVRVARSRAHPGRCRAVDAEDIALEAFLEFCGRLSRPDSEARFPQLQTREQVWKLLVCFTVRAAFDHNQKEARRAAAVSGESGLPDAGLGGFAGREPAPEFAAAVSELLGRLQDESLRLVAVRKMEGHSVQEIAREMDCSPSTVERKLRAIRALWRAAGDAP